MGTAGERMAFFPEKAPSADDWHGFPLFLTPALRPATELTKRWLADGVIRFATQKKMLRGKV